MKPDQPGPAVTAASGREPTVGRFSSLTSEIVEQFGKEITKSGQFNERIVRKLLAVALAEASPRTKDIEALLQEEEPLE